MYRNRRILEGCCRCRRLEGRHRRILFHDRSSRLGRYYLYRTRLHGKLKQYLQDHGHARLVVQRNLPMAPKEAVNGMLFRHNHQSHRLHQ